MSSYVSGCHPWSSASCASILVLRMQWLDWGQTQVKLRPDTSVTIGPDLYLKETRVIQTCDA